MKKAFFFITVATSLILWVAAVDKNDWEEINFEFNSSILVDGFPSLLRLADILAGNPQYRLGIEGHCDSIGGPSYNDALSIKRANTVREFLIKYGARPEQIEVSGKGNRQPEVENITPEGRFMNRRVVFTLYRLKDGKKEVIKADSPISTVLKEIDKDPVRQKLDDIGHKQDALLEKMAKLDELSKALEQLKELQERQTRTEQELAALKERLKQSETTPATSVATQVPAPTSPPMPATAPPPASIPPTEVKTIEAPPASNRVPLKINDLSLLGLDVGTTQKGQLTGNASARFFHRFTMETALQAQGEYLFYPDRREFQLDLGLVKRYSQFQLGAFTSLKRVDQDTFSNGGNLAQVSFSAEYLFRQGSIGGFATHGLTRHSIVEQTPTSGNLIRETYLRTLDQYGLTFSLSLPIQSFIEGNAGYIHRGEGLSAKPGGLLRLVHPLDDRWGLTFEGAWNEGLISDKGSGRFAVGLRYGLWRQPSRSAESDVVPMDVPRLRYDVRTRIIKTGNSSPVADAGPDQINVPAGLIHLDGSASHDPDGDSLTYQWVQVQGPIVALQGTASATATFTAENDQTYVFRLRVADPQGAYDTDDVVVTTRPVPQTPELEILYFFANPATIITGQKALLTWKVINTTSVEITGIGPVSVNGNMEVSPTTTTTYTLIAKGDNKEVRATALINVTSTTVNHPPVAFAGLTQYADWFGTFTLDGSGSFDPDGDPITFHWQQVGGPLVSLSAPDQAITTFSANEKGIYTFKLVVSDNRGAAGSDEVRVCIF